MRGSLRSKACLKNKFKQLIQTLRNRTSFKQQIQHPIDPTLQSPILTSVHDIVPITQIDLTNRNIINEIDSNSSDNSSQIIRFQMKELKNMKDIQEYIDEDVQNQSMYQLETGNRFLVNQLTDLLRPQQKLQLPKNEGRSGCIRRQRFMPSKPKAIKQPKYLKIPRISERQAAQAAQAKPKQHFQQVKQVHQTKQLGTKEADSEIKKRTSIKQIKDIEIIKYWNSSTKIHEESTIQEMYTLFTELINTIHLHILNPVIKKYKNCAYFGEQPQRDQKYEGFIYYYKKRLYYGELINGNKHGQGTQINFEENTIYSGVFDTGKKNGLFKVQKERQNYEGMLMFGIYEGEGKLSTQDYVYTGNFQNGKKHGFGEEYYPKTGLRLKGCFKHGEQENLDKSKILADSSSEVEIKSKPSSIVAKNPIYDIDLQLQNTFKRQIQGSYYNKQVLSNVKQSGKQDERNLEDSKSLYDILTNRSKANKYDYRNDSNILLPKIQIEGIRTQYKDTNPQHFLKNDQSTGSRLQSPIKKRYHSQQQKPGISVADTDLPLSKRKVHLPLK